MAGLAGITLACMLDYSCLEQRNLGCRNRNDQHDPAMLCSTYITMFDCATELCPSCSEPELAGECNLACNFCDDVNRDTTVGAALDFAIVTNGVSVPNSHTAGHTAPDHMHVRTSRVCNHR
jgi:hypothetical protein